MSNKTWEIIHFVVGVFESLLAIGILWSVHDWTRLLVGLILGRLAMFDLFVSGEYRSRQ